MALEASVLDMLDTGEALSPPARTLLLARLGGAAVAPESLPLGALSRLILRLRGQLLGDTVEATATCPHCQERASCELSSAELADDQEQATEPFDVQHGGYTARCRPVTGGDLLDAAESGREGARARLIAATVLQARRGRQRVDPLELPAPVLEEIGRRLLEADPLADIVLSLTCEACGGEWDTTLDIGDFVWRELHHWGRQVLWEVHTLAQAYGWREPDILAIPPRRRRVYLEWVANG